MAFSYVLTAIVCIVAILLCFPVVFAMPNQWKPNPPPEMLEEHARKYYQMGMARKDILENLKDHYDTEQYGLGLTKFKAYCNMWGLLGTRQQGHSFDSIEEPIMTLRQRFPNIGAPELRNLLRHEYDMKVPRKLILDYLNLTEREAVIARTGRRFKRKRFYAAGVNHIWAVDQHDKWKRFGLYFHIGIEVFSGKVLWLKVWWTNSNPRMVSREYFNTIRRVGGIPLLTQSDLGSENFGIANAQTCIRQRLDATLEGTLQHHWMRGHSNIKPEIAWSQFRARWAPGFEDLLEQGLTMGWYDPVNTLQRMVFLWIAIPFIQAEVDRYVYRHNSNARRADRHKILPHGIPDLIFEKPERFNAQDFKIEVPPEVLTAAEADWAPSDHPVFQLVNPVFEQFVVGHYTMLGQPMITFTTFWDVYNTLLASCQQGINHGEDAQVPVVLAALAEAPEAGENQGMPLLVNQAPCAFGVNGIPPLIIREDIVHDFVQVQANDHAGITNANGDIQNRPGGDDEMEEIDEIDIAEYEVDFSDDEHLDELW